MHEAAQILLEAQFSETKFAADLQSVNWKRTFKFLHLIGSPLAESSTKMFAGNVRYSFQVMIGSI